MHTLARCLVLITGCLTMVGVAAYSGQGVVAAAPYDVWIMQTKQKKRIITLLLDDQGRACSMKGVLREGALGRLPLDQVQDKRDCIMGTYSVNGNQMTILWPTLANTRYGRLLLTREGAGWRKNKREIYKRAKPFAQGATLNGEYVVEVGGASGIVGRMTATSFAKGRYSFESNRRFKRYSFRAGSASIYETSGHTRENMTTNHEDESGGDYSLTGFQLRLNHDNGKTETVTIFQLPHNDAILIIDGGRYSRR